MRVLLGYSGGLDTSFLVAWLTREQNAQVTALAVDCGGFTDAERREMGDRARELGAVDFRVVDARAEMFDRMLRYLIAANVKRGGVYPLCVGAERGLQAEVLARVALEEGFDAVAHGCTAAGNDQVRFEAALGTIAPQLQVIAPVRDLGLERSFERDYLAKLGKAPPESRARYSVNQGLWGLTIGGGEMATSEQPLPEAAWVWTAGGLDAAPRTVRIGFDRGTPSRLDGVAHDPVTLLETLNRLAGAHGVGRGYHLGDTVLGIKGRIAFEAPAAEVILTAHKELEKLVLTEEQRFWKDHLGEVYGRRLHQGLFHDPFQRDLEAFFASSLVEGISSPFSMMAASDARYGERAASHSDPKSAVGLARLLAEPGRLHRRAGNAAGEK
jgi:argininosuccinate synthase